VLAEAASLHEKLEGDWLLEFERTLTNLHGPAWWHTLGIPPFPGRALKIRPQQ
jgi:hypothetical protein